MICPAALKSSGGKTPWAVKKPLAEWRVVDWTRGCLCGIIIRFREEPVALSVDIQQMFLQVVVEENDRKYPRFL